MKLVLNIESGPQKGRQVVVHPGEQAEIGRRGREFEIPEDVALSRAHFRVQCTRVGAQATITDLQSSNGTYVNGKRIEQAELKDGDKIRAGDTTFAVTIEGTAAAAVVKEPEPAVEARDPLEVLRSQKEPLYAILDAARDPRILELLKESGEDYRCLYNGASAVNLADAAPYLVKLPPDSDLLETLVEEGWGKSWGVYLTCERPMAEVRKHLRKFLMVELEGRQVLFRFYDPRVLRLYLPTCSTEEKRTFIGPLSFLMELPASAKVDVPINPKGHVHETDIVRIDCASSRVQS